MLPGLSSDVPVPSRGSFPRLVRYPGPKRRRGSSESLTGTDTDIDEAFTAENRGDEVPSPTKKRKEGADDHGFSRLSLSQGPTVEGPDSPTYEDIDDDEDIEEDLPEASILHPLVAEHLRKAPPPLVPLWPDKATQALVLYQPVLRTTKPDEVEEADSGEDETTLSWPGKRRRRRASQVETIEIDPEDPWPRGPALRVGTPRSELPSLPTYGVTAESQDAMDIDE